MIELTLSGGDSTEIFADLVGGETERCAVLFANHYVRTDGRTRILVRAFEFPGPTDYTQIGIYEAQLKPEFVARVTKRARAERCALVFVHSHPGSAPPRFSAVDDEGEAHLAAFLAVRVPDHPHAALVISAGGVRCRLLGSDTEIRVVSLGDQRKVLFDPSPNSTATEEIFDRQVRAFGSAGQRLLEELHVAVVGLGGTGSLVAQQCAHLGVRRLTLVDPDTIEVTNLNRVANAAPSDVGRAKVDLASEYISRVRPDAKIITHEGNVVLKSVAQTLLDADLIFGCTDSHGSRAVLQQIAYQYMIPFVDMGVTIAVNDGSITHIYGRVQLLAPGLACFACDGLLNAEEVRRDMMSDVERRADPYIPGSREPAPAVMSLNGTVASLAITMMLSLVAGVPSKARHLLYNAMASSMRAVRARPRPDCYICSRSGSLGRADSWPLFLREG